jgi:hypothetical protein
VSQKDESPPQVKPDAGIPSHPLPQEDEEGLNLTQKLVKMRRERQELALRSNTEISNNSNVIISTNSNGETRTDEDDSEDIVDWVELAEILEAGNLDPLEGDDDDDITNATSVQDSERLYFEFFLQRPRDLVTMTLRSELIDSLSQTHGDTSDPRFVSALELLAKIFRSTTTSAATQAPLDIALTDIPHGHWKSITHAPYHYGGSLGTNEAGETVYTLGKMCFNMFKPGNLRVTVQNTMNSIEPVCRMDQAPSAAPWSLRRELALQGDESSSADDAGEQSQPQQEQLPNTMLATYDIAAALTIEPGQFKAPPGEVIPSPPRRLRATHVVKGFFLPDPNTPNRMTIWFTGGYLSPVLPPSPDGASGEEPPDPSLGTLDDWIGLFGAEHKRTWGEALGVLGAKLLLGASLPSGMEPDGTMSYTLHRPYGGHGRGYVDILYADHELFITKGNSGTIHAMVRDR